VTTPDQRSRDFKKAIHDMAMCFFRPSPVFKYLCRNEKNLVLLQEQRDMNGFKHPRRAR